MESASIYFWLLAALVIVCLAWVWPKPQRIYQYPGFLAATFAIFLLPQAVSLVRYPGSASGPAISNVLLMASLCLLAGIAGYRVQLQPGIVKLFSRALDENRLFHVGLAFVACGFVAGQLMLNTDVQFAERGGMTGAGTIYLFFGQLVFPGFAICLHAALRKPSLLTLLAVCVASILPLESLVGGRREPAALFVLSLGLGFFFWKNLAPSRLLVAVAGVAAMLAIPATGTFRGLQAQGNWSGIQQLNLWANFRSFLDSESNLELRNAAILIEHTRETGSYRFGVDYWNHLVFRFVPAQWLGTEFKRRLMVDSDDGPIGMVSQIFEDSGYQASVGSTVTGLGDSFQQFGWFGCLVFAAMAALFRALWLAAARNQSLFAQLLYINLTTTGMRALTHWTLDFLPGLLYTLLFLGAASLYAVAPKNSARPVRRPRPGGKTAGVHVSLAEQNLTSSAKGVNGLE